MTKPVERTYNRPYPLPRFPYRHVENLDWMEDARCVGMDPELFFPKKPPGDNRYREPAAAAIIRKACDHCPVAEQCLQYGKDTGATRGVWGGVDFGAHRRREDDDE